MKNLSAGVNNLIVGAAVRVAPFENATLMPVLLGVRKANGSVMTFVSLCEDGRIGLYLNDQRISKSNISAPVRGWHYIEMQASSSTGSIIVRVNGVLAIYQTMVYALETGGPLLTAFLGAVPGAYCPVTVDVDDLYLADVGGPINSTFLGDVRVDALQVQGDGSLNQWTVEGASSAWAAVSDGNEATAIRAATAGLRQTFDVAPLPAMSAPAIHGVQLTMLARKTDAGNGRVRGLVASGAQTAVSADLVLQEQLAWHTAMFEGNPNGNVQWTEAAFNAAEFGVESA